MIAYRGDCRFCQRRGAACGREHTLTTRADWARDYSGDTPENEGLAEQGTIANRLEYLRGEIRAERISYGEIAELQGLAEHIASDDVELLEWAGGTRVNDRGRYREHTYSESRDRGRAQHARQDLTEARAVLAEFNQGTHLLAAPSRAPQQSVRRERRV